MHAQPIDAAAAGAARPTGRRRITPRMLAARAARPPSYAPTKPGLALGALKRAAEAIGCPARVVQLVDYLIGCTAPADWAAGDGGPIWAWPGNARLQDALGVERTRLKTLFRVGEELGLFEIHDSPNGQRWGHRDAAGRVTAAYGFDLAPLASRVPELRRIAAERAARWREGERLRKAITATRNKVLALCDLAREAGAAGDWEAVAGEARRLAAARGASRDPDDLAPLLDALGALRAGAAEALTPPPLAPPSPEPVESGPTGAAERPPLTPTNHVSIAKANTTAGPSRPEQKHAGARAPVETGTRERGAAGSALRGFVVTPDFVLRVAPRFAGWVRAPNPGWAELLDAAGLVRSELGISQHAWGQACVALGRIEALAALAAIAARHDAGEVGSPGGLLRRMVELHEAGTLRLDRTLFGLADRLAGRAH